MHEIDITPIEKWYMTARIRQLLTVLLTHFDRKEKNSIFYVTPFTPHVQLDVSMAFSKNYAHDIAKNFI